MSAQEPCLLWQDVKFNKENQRPTIPSPFSSALRLSKASRNISQHVDVRRLLPLAFVL
jgi:hypothetical protein